jgi:hypothetical protein
MIERDILIGLITSKEYLEQIQNYWQPTLLEATLTRKLSTWCWEYFDKFAKPPGRDIESIILQKLKSKHLEKDLFTELEEDILPGLSTEYEKQTFGVESLLERTKEYFEERHLTVHLETLEALRLAGKIKEAKELASDYKPLETTAIILDNFIQDVYQIKSKTKEKPKTLLTPWLKEGQMTIIYGNYGTGKSLLAISVAYIMGLKDYISKEAEIGEWQVKRPTGTLYIDGELGELEMEERINSFAWLGIQAPRFRTKIFSIPEYQLATQDSFYLSNRSNQLKILGWLKDNPHYKVVVLDSASTLFGLVEENDNSEWNVKINPFLRDLRALGVACLLLHHSGKDGKKGLRGASAMGAMAHNIFRLTNHGDKSVDDGEAWFILSKDKQRSGGYSFKTFCMKFVQNDEKTETSWKVNKNF